jgi:serine/threonine protein kinase
MEIPGYKGLVQIHSSLSSKIFRARSEPGDRSVVLKFLNKEYPTQSDVFRYQKEFEFLDQLKGAPHVIQAYSMESAGDSPFIVLEDFEGLSLGAWLDRQRVFSLEEVLEIAIQVTVSLGEIHDGGVIHKDVNPSNILFNPEMGEVRLIDFGLASAHTSEVPNMKPPSLIQGTLAYISPEQTGRMNR